MYEIISKFVQVNVVCKIPACVRDWLPLDDQVAQIDAYRNQISILSRKITAMLSGSISS